MEHIKKNNKKQLKPFFLIKKTCFKTTFKKNGFKRNPIPDYRLRESVNITMPGSILGGSGSYRNMFLLRNRLPFVGYVPQL